MYRTITKKKCNTITIMNFYYMHIEVKQYAKLVHSLVSTDSCFLNFLEGTLTKLCICSKLCNLVILKKKTVLI